jgi:GNAT superfamily N-acetyltransferase
MTPRLATEADLDPLARLWHAGWHEAHAAIVPASLTRLRTLPAFRDRLAGMGGDMRAAGPEGAPLGFCAIKGDELYQLFVASEARGTGLSAALLEDGEKRLAARGVRRAFLLCANGNDRAARFYERAGWENLGLRREAVDTADGPFAFDLLRFEKTLQP